jgi:glycosyltransferase involved in cell wall biosynthesis
MQKTKKVSVVIPAYNASRTLRKTLQTIRSQDDFDMEVVVVDDASTEDISAMADEMRAILHRLPENSGPATARTKGAEIATGEIVLFTDSDVWLPEDILEKVRKDFEEKPCECVQGTFSARCPHSNFYSQYKNLYNRFVLGRLGEWINTTYTSVTAVKKDFFLQCGGFDTGIETASVEDRTLGESIVRAGGKIYLDRSIEVVHNKKFTAAGFYRHQFRRSRDLAKLRQRQKTSGFLKDGETFGTTSKKSMARLPSAVFCLIGLVACMASPWFAVPATLFGLFYAVMSRSWASFLLQNKGFWFALRGQLVDFTDALVSAAGVAAGLFEYKVLGKKY